MRRLGAMARPDIAVYTLIGRSHLEALGDLDGVLRAKGELIDEMPPDGLVIVNGDDERLAAWQPGRRKLTYGFGESCDVRGSNFRARGTEGSELTVAARGQRIELSLPAYGRHMAYAALAAAAVGLELGLSGGEIAAGAADYVPVGRRARIVETPIADRYRRLLQREPGLGEDGDRLRRRARREARVRPRGHARAWGRIRAAAPRSWPRGEGRRGRAADDGRAQPRDGRRALREQGGAHRRPAGILRRGDRVLVKASHSMAFEEISDALHSEIAR